MKQVMKNVTEVVIILDVDDTDVLWYQIEWTRNDKNLPYFPTDNVHLTYNAHPKLFYIPFEVQITRT